VPPGSARYWSWLFAAASAREPLLGIYALTAEWRALLDPGTEPSVAQAKLVWWRDEVRRLTAGSPLHPITRHIAALPNAASADLARLDAVVAAVAAEAAGVPLERASELGAHADALYGVPLLVAARLGDPHGDSAGVRGCITSLAGAQYLARALHGYRREAQAGRIAFAVDELLAAGIDNDDLVAPLPPPQLARYLDELRRRAAEHFATAAHVLEPAERAALRHLAVLIRLGARHLSEQRSPSGADFHFADLYNAWNAARRAAAGR
jgi:phytoene synthase